MTSRHDRDQRTENPVVRGSYGSAPTIENQADRRDCARLSKGIDAMSTAWQTLGQLNMLPHRLNIYSSLPYAGPSLSCRLSRVLESACEELDGGGPTVGFRPGLLATAGVLRWRGGCGYGRRGTVGALLVDIPTLAGHARRDTVAASVKPSAKEPW
jgi:hypothetical protein